MNTNYNINTEINAILFLLDKEYGISDIDTLSIMLYYADQYSLANFGRSITNDKYVASYLIPMPLHLKSILHSNKFYIYNDCYTVLAQTEYNRDYLSLSDIESLNYAFNKCDGCSLLELISMSRGYVYKRTKSNNIISIRDIMREAKCSEEYIEYVINLDLIQKSLL